LWAALHPLLFFNHYFSTKMKNLPLALLLTLCAPFFLTAQTTAAIDATFGVNGVATIKFSSHGPSKAWAAEVAPDGKIVATGSADQSLVVSRWLSNGQPDATFGNNGLSVSEASPYFTSPLVVALQPNGKIVAASNMGTLNGSQVTIVRFLTGSTIGTSEQVFPRAARMASPNTFSEFLRLDFSTLPAVPSEVAVFDLNGRRVFVAHEISAQSTDIQEVASWQPGVYLLRATTPRGTFVQKIVKQ
jgi:WD40 repeat protein